MNARYVIVGPHNGGMCSAMVVPCTSIADARRIVASDISYHEKYGDPTGYEYSVHDFADLLDGDFDQGLVDGYPLRRLIVGPRGGVQVHNT